MNTSTLEHPRNRSALRTVRLLVACYLSLSVLTLAAIVVLRNHATLVTPAVWGRGTIVVLTGALMMSFAAGAARGSGRAYLRLRIASGVMVAAIAVIVALPGDFPLWIKVEQAACGLLLLGVVRMVNGRRLRSAFAR